MSIVSPNIHSHSFTLHIDNLGTKLLSASSLRVFFLSDKTNIFLNFYTFLLLTVLLLVLLLLELF